MDEDAKISNTSATSNDFLANARTLGFNTDFTKILQDLINNDSTKTPNNARRRNSFSEGVQTPRFPQPKTPRAAKTSEETTTTFQWHQVKTPRTARISEEPITTIQPEELISPFITPKKEDQHPENQNDIYETVSSPPGSVITEIDETQKDPSADEKPKSLFHGLIKKSDQGFTLKPIFFYSILCLLPTTVIITCIATKTIVQRNLKRQIVDLKAIVASHTTAANVEKPTKTVVKKTFQRN